MNDYNDKITVEFAARRTGKTTKALGQFMLNPQNTFLCVLNKRDILYSFPNFNNEKYYIFQKPKKSRFHDFLRGFRFTADTNFIFDDWYEYPFETRKFLYKFVHNLEEFPNVFVYSTPQRIYKTKDFETVENLKKLKPLSYFYGYNEELDNGILGIFDECSPDLKELFFDFSTDPEANLVQTGYVVTEKVRSQIYRQAFEAELSYNETQKYEKTNIFGQFLV